MFENLDIFKVSTALAKHAGQRQALVAQNVANADTPKYVPRDLPPFKAAYAQGGGVERQKTTRALHLSAGTSKGGAPESREVASQASPNGNQVSLESEMLKSVDAKRQHDRALAIYKSGLGILRSTLRGT